MSILGASAPHNLGPMPRFSASKGRSVLFMQRGERPGCGGGGGGLACSMSEFHSGDQSSPPVRDLQFTVCVFSHAQQLGSVDGMTVCRSVHHLRPD